MVAVVLMSILAVAGLCILADRLAAYPLPFKLGANAAQLAYRTGAGLRRARRRRGLCARPRRHQGSCTVRNLAANLLHHRRGLGRSFLVAPLGG